MSLESGSFIQDLVDTNPSSTDFRRQGDDHLRLIKSVLRSTFPNADKAFRFADAVVKTADYTLQSTDENMLVCGDTTSGAITLTLPTLASGDAGWAAYLCKSDTTVNEVTINGTVNGVASRKIYSPYDLVQVFWNGSAWFARSSQLALRPVSLSADTTLTLDQLGSVEVSTFEGDVSITLPSVTAAKGRAVAVTKTAAANDLTIVGTINGEANLILTGLYTTVTLYSNGVAWLVIGGSTSSVPVGAVMDFAGPTAPTGWLLCYGQNVSRTIYASLFAVLGTTYGAGDGSTTFGIPDARGRVIAGQDDMGGVSANRLTAQSDGVDGDTLGASGGTETHTLTEAQLAAHNHEFYASSLGGSGNATGGVNAFSTSFAGFTSGGATYNDVFPASATQGINDTGSDAAHNNVQPTLILNKIIKT